jgi:hypothetical protein
MKIKKIVEIVKDAYNEYQSKKIEYEKNARIYGFEAHDYMVVLLEKRLRAHGIEKAEIIVISETRGFIIHGSTLFDYVIIDSTNSARVIIYKYYLEKSIETVIN